MTEPTLIEMAAAYAKRKMTMAAEGRVVVDGVEYRVLPYQVEYFKTDLAKFDDPKWRKQVVQQYLGKHYIVRASRPGAKATHAARDSKEATAAGLKVGDIVKYRSIVDEGDREWRARIVELRGPRLLVSLDVMPGFKESRLPPSQAVAVSDVVKASRPGAKAKFAVKVGDRVHAGLATAGGAGVVGTVTKIEDGFVHIRADDSANDKYGPKTYKAPLRLVTDASKKAWESSKSTHAARTGLAVTAAEYAAIVARDAVTKRITSDSQYQITAEDRAIRAAGDAAYKAAQQRNEAWHREWLEASSDAERANVEARAKAAEAGMKLYRASRASAKSTHAALPTQTLEAERRPGGGSHSEAVSRKIATLINEGKPQDQAVAIALDLERRGEL